MFPTRWEPRLCYRYRLRAKGYPVCIGYRNTHTEHTAYYRENPVDLYPSPPVRLGQSRDDPGLFKPYPM